MAKPRESSKAAVLLAGLLIVPMLLLCLYVATYFVCSENTPQPPGRWFASEAQFRFFYPLARLEQWLRGPDFGIGDDVDYILSFDRSGNSYTLARDLRDWTPADGQEFIAEFIERTGDTVRMRTTDDEIIDVPLDSLSEQDREWVELNHAASTNDDAFVGANAGATRRVGGVEVCWCPPGHFVMGSPPDEPRHRGDESQVEVTLTQGFWMGKYEVTQSQWRDVVGTLPGIVNADVGEEFPLYSVNFSEADEFCSKLTEQARRSGELPPNWKFGLPTEAQWEYACRAGTTTPFSFGENLTSAQACFGKPYNGTPTGVPGSASSKAGSYAANGWGLHDMHGNEWEWCRDWYHAQLPGGVDPDLSELKGSPNRDGTYSRVRRGGAWVESVEFCRSAVRLRYEPERRADHIGFRVIAYRP